MENKIIKAIILPIVFFMMLVNCTYVQAVVNDNSSEAVDIKQVAALTNPFDDPTVYKPGGLDNADKVKSIGNKIIGIVQFIGTFASVITLIVMGIKYMLGSVEEKAEYKKTMMPYVIGAIMVFAITNLLAIISSVTDGLF